MLTRRDSTQHNVRPGHPVAGDEHSRAITPQALKVRVAELERQVKRLEMEKEILKKATAYFASHSP